MGAWTSCTQSGSTTCSMTPQRAAMLQGHRSASRQGGPKLQALKFEAGDQSTLEGAAQRLQGLQRSPQWSFQIEMAQRVSRYSALCNPLLRLCAVSPPPNFKCSYSGRTKITSFPIFPYKSAIFDRLCPLIQPLPIN